MNYRTIYGVEVPAVWCICGVCHGEGKSSAYLGAFSRQEFEEEFDYEEQEAYFNGEYDRTCDHCNGSGKVLEIDYEACNPEQKEVVETYYDDLAEQHSEQRMLERGYQF